MASSAAAPAASSAAATVTSSAAAPVASSAARYDARRGFAAGGFPALPDASSGAPSAGASFSESPAAASSATSPAACAAATSSAACPAAAARAVTSIADSAACLFAGIPATSSVAASPVQPPVACTKVVPVAASAVQVTPACVARSDAAGPSFESFSSSSSAYSSSSSASFVPVLSFSRSFLPPSHAPPSNSVATAATAAPHPLRPRSRSPSAARHCRTAAEASPAAAAAPTTASASSVAASLAAETAAASGATGLPVSGCPYRQTCGDAATAAAPSNLLLWLNKKQRRETQRMNCIDARDSGGVATAAAAATAAAEGVATDAVNCEEAPLVAAACGRGATAGDAFLATAGAATVKRGSGAAADQTAAPAAAIHTAAAAAALHTAAAETSGTESVLRSLWSRVVSCSSARDSEPLSSSFSSSRGGFATGEATAGAAAADALVAEREQPRCPATAAGSSSSSGSSNRHGQQQEGEEEEEKERIDPRNMMPHISNERRSEPSCCCAAARASGGTTAGKTEPLQQLEEDSVEQQLSTHRRTSSIPVTGTEDKLWLYPSPLQFYRALRRKEKAPPPDAMASTVYVHDVVNERTWKQILQWENIHAKKCPRPTLSRFVGRSDVLSPAARWRSYFSPMGAPFDRHDWLVNRCGETVRYIIDYYDDSQGDDNIQVYIHARPALFDSWRNFCDRLRHLFFGFGSPPSSSSSKST